LLHIAIRAIRGFRHFDTESLASYDEMHKMITFYCYLYSLTSMQKSKNGLTAVLLRACQLASLMREKITDSKTTIQ
jgi:hypothetical protein